MLTRRVKAQVTIAGKDVTNDIKNFLTSVTYTDVLEGEADTAQINLHDIPRVFIADWFPKRGDTAEITLIRENWNEESGTENLYLGSFEIDEITNAYSGSGNTASIKLNSIANKSDLRSIDKSRSWEKVKLSKIAADIAAEAGLKLFYDTKEDPEIPRAEQKEKTNLQFLNKLCKDKGLAVKISDNKLIIFDEEKYEQQDPVKTLTYGDGKIKSFSARATISKIYKSCHVKYQHGKQAEKFEHTFTDESKEEGMTLEISQKVENSADAEKLAKKKLREKNKDEIKVSLSIVGNFAYLAGNCIELKDHGFYDGKYLITKATHSIGKDYSVSLEVRKCLNGY